jgi:hypothetical protein
MTGSSLFPSVGGVEGVGGVVVLQPFQVPGRPTPPCGHPSAEGIGGHWFTDNRYPELTLGRASAEAVC